MKNKIKLIDKAKVIEEIEKKKIPFKRDIEDGYYPTYLCALMDFEDFINSLEVEEPVSEDLEDAIIQSFIYHENHGDDFRSDKQIETAYRYGFEAGVKYKELTSSIIENIEKQNLEMKEMSLEKEIKDYFNSQPIITRSKGFDYQLIPSGEDIAKHFFELGLKMKGE